jgi:hypothetical protein
MNAREGVDRIQPVKDNIQWQDFVNMVINPCVLQRQGRQAKCVTSFAQQTSLIQLYHALHTISWFPSPNGLIKIHNQ